MNLPPVTPTSGPAPPRPVALAVTAAGRDSLALLSQLAIGEILSGTVLERGPDGTVTLRTDRGVLALAGTFEAPVGSQITLEVRSAGARLQFVLLAVGNDPAATTLLNAAKPSPPGGIDVGRTAPGQSNVGQTGDAAAVARIATTGPTTPSAPPPVADAASLAGTRVVATVLRPVDSAPPTKAATPTPPSGPAAMPAPGQRLPYHLAAILPPGTEAVTATGSAPPREAIIATLRGTMPDGRLVLDSTLGTILLDRMPGGATTRPATPAGTPAQNVVPPSASTVAEEAPLGTTLIPGRALSLPIAADANAGGTPPASGNASPTQPANPGRPNAGLPEGAAQSATSRTATAPLWPPGTRLVLALPLPPGGSAAEPAMAAGPRVTATILRAPDTAARLISVVNAPIAATPALPSPVPATSSNAANLSAPPPAAGQKLALELVSVLPFAADTAPSQAMAQPAAPNAIVATLKQVSPNGQPILATPLGLVALDREVDWPAGTRLVMLPLPETPAPIPSEAGRGQIWGALLETAALLDQDGSMLPASTNATNAAPGLSTSPASMAASLRAEDLLAQNLPRLGPYLAAGLATFLRARLGDDGTQWPGPDLRRALEAAGRPELVARLEQGFAELARLAPGNDGNWRSVILPLLDEHALHQARLAVRRDPPKGQMPADDRPASVHFLLDVELSRLGAMQLDGLVRGKRFDLMLRTHKPLDRFMQREIESLFAEAKSATGLAGEIFFQVAATFAAPGGAPPAPGKAGVIA